MSNSHVLFGAGSLLGDLLDIIHLQQGRLKKIVLNAPLSETVSQKIARLNIPTEPLSEFTPEENEIYAIGFKGMQMQPLKEHLKKRFNLHFSPLIHPSTIVSPHAHVSEGCILGAGVILASGAYLHSHVVINRGSSIGHDCTLGSYVFIGPGACLCSHVHIEEGAQVSAGATVIEYKRIGRSAVVAAGAVCLKDVEPFAMVAGVPATPRKPIAKAP